MWIMGVCYLLKHYCVFIKASLYTSFFEIEFSKLVRLDQKFWTTQWDW